MSRASKKPDGRTSATEATLSVAALAGKTPAPDTTSRPPTPHPTSFCEIWPALGVESRVQQCLFRAGSARTADSVFDNLALRDFALRLSPCALTRRSRIGGPTKWTTSEICETSGVWPCGRRMRFSVSARLPKDRGPWMALAKRRGPSPSRAAKTLAAGPGRRVLDVRRSSRGQTAGPTRVRCPERCTPAVPARPAFRPATSLSRTHKEARPTPSKQCPTTHAQMPICQRNESGISSLGAWALGIRRQPLVTLRPLPTGCYGH